MMLRHAAVIEATAAWRKWTTEKTQIKEFNPSKSNRKPPPYKHVRVCVHVWHLIVPAAFLNLTGVQIRDAF